MMNCSCCQKNITEKSWLHLSNLPSVNEEGKNIVINKHICSYSCYKKLYDSKSIPKKFSFHVVNKEDYQDLIRPVSRTQKKSFEYLTFHEINQLSDEEKEKYYFERSEQLHINPIMYEIQDEMNYEDQKTSYLESLSSDDEVIYDDY